jgi:hypothetical protein
MEGLRVQQRVDVADLQAGTQVIAQVVGMLGPQLGLALVQPPGPDAMLEVTLPGLGPDVLPGPGLVAS